MELTPQDHTLIQAAKDLISKLFNSKRHVIGAALCTANGEIYTAVHLEARVGRVAICAEAAVLGKQIGVVEYIPKDAFADAVLLETLRQMDLI